MFLEIIGLASTPFSTAEFNEASFLVLGGKRDVAISLKREFTPIFAGQYSISTNSLRVQVLTT